MLSPEELRKWHLACTDLGTLTAIDRYPPTTCEAILYFSLDTTNEQAQAIIDHHNKALAHIDEQAEQLRKANEALAEAREELEGYALYCTCWVQNDETKMPHYRKCQGQDARRWLERHPAPTGPNEGE